MSLLLDFLVHWYKIRRGQIKGFGVTKPSTHLTAALMLADSALAVLRDAVSELEDAGDKDGHQEISTIANELSEAVGYLRERRKAAQLGVMRHEGSAKHISNSKRASKA
jgi:hypothetical protein